jgi:glutamate N-acetyltransferase/amino-acid N-acetyltransferase
LAAAGRAGVRFDPSSASVFIDGICICKDGLPCDAAADAEASARMKKEEYVIELVLGNGPGKFSYVTCDLGHAYIDINAGYRS